MKIQIRHRPRAWRPLLGAGPRRLRLLARSSARSLDVRPSARTATRQRPRAPPPAPRRRRRSPSSAAAEHPGASSSRPPTAARCGSSARSVRSSAQFGAATGTFTPGTRRLAFGLNAGSGAFIYAPTAVYIARSAEPPARGPYLAPADPMTVPPQYRSQQNAGPGGIQAIYAAQLPIPQRRHLHGPGADPHQQGADRLARGDRRRARPRRSPTSASARPTSPPTRRPRVGGNIALLTTRTPAGADALGRRCNQVLGKRPVALLFSTPQFCVSRVCGPVTDVAVELQHEFGNRITFIHEEVYVDNQPEPGPAPADEGVPPADRAVAVHDQPPRG